MLVVFNADFTGPNDNPWPLFQWINDSSGTGATIIESNVGRMAVNEVPNDARALAYLSLTDARIDMLIEIPTGTQGTGGPFYGFGVNMRGDSWWADENGGSGGPHDPLSGYRFALYRHATDGSLSNTIYRLDNGVATALDGNTFGDSSVLTVRMRVEAIGTALRLVARDASAGALPATWDVDVSDAGFDSGIITISVRGPLGGSIPARVGYLHEFQVSVPNGAGGPHVGSRRVIS